MKKNLFLPILCLALFLVSCGSSSSKNEKEKINYDYQGACYENDFEKAHLIINKMKSKDVFVYCFISAFYALKGRKVKS